LVLLLEDITSWEGLDDSLIDVLVFNAAARGEPSEQAVCPLISVVGVTPAYYDKLQPNYRQRITHEVRLGKATDGLQDVATLRESDSRRRFASRYLAAVRAGPVALNAWFADLRQGQDSAPPNRCDTCPRQGACFNTFGEEGGIGLFPFTSHSFDRFYEALKENDNGQTWKTPRGILQAILNPNLLQPQTLEAGTYPGSFIESDALRSDRRSNLALSLRLEQIVDKRIEEPEERARMRRLLAYWANPDRADTTIVGDELAFAGAKRSVFDAFGLPWLGDDQPNRVNASASFINPQPVFEAPAPVVQNVDADGSGAQNVPSQRPTRPIVSAPKPKRLMPSTTDLEILREQIRTWSLSGSIENGSKWNDILYLLVERLDPRSVGVTPPLFQRLFTREMVKLQGTTTRSLNYFILPAETWVRNGLEAFVSLRQDVGMSLADAEYHRRNLAAMMRRLEKSVADFVDQKIPKCPDGTRWSPVATFAQILLARAYLRGATHADAPIVGQLKAILSDEGASEADYSSRSAPWQEWLTSTKGYHERFRAELRAMVSLNLTENLSGTGGGAALVDSSEFAGAVNRLVTTGQFDPAPENGDGLPDFYRKACELAHLWIDKRIHIERIEFAQIKNRSDALSKLLRGKDIATHLERLDRSITAIAEQLPGASVDKVQSWKSSYERLKIRVGEGLGEQVEDVIYALESQEIPARLPLKLSWLAKQPARDLEEILTTAQNGERAVEELRDHALDCVREAGGRGSLADIKAVGRAILAAVQGSQVKTHQHD
jgi:hypothetical protein